MEKEETIEIYENHENLLQLAIEFDTRLMNVTGIIINTCVLFPVAY